MEPKEPPLDQPLPCQSILGSRDTLTIQGSYWDGHTPHTAPPVRVSQDPEILWPSRNHTGMDIHHTQRPCQSILGSRDTLTIPPHLYRDTQTRRGDCPLPILHRMIRLLLSYAGKLKGLSCSLSYSTTQKCGLGEMNSTHPQSHSYYAVKM